MTSKMCSKCKQTKLLSEYPKAPTCISGYRNYCRECKNKQTSLYYHQNTVVYKQNAARWKEENPEKTRQIKANWKKRNSVWVAADNGRRYATYLTNTLEPSKELTDFVYEQAQELRKLRNKFTNIEWHVDHIIPLRGKLVSGLHVWNNFAVIPAKDNQRKNNTYAISEERCPPV